MSNLSPNQVEVNAWTLRCIFNQSHIPERIAAGEFTVTLRTKANLSKMPNHPKDTRSQHMWIYDQSGVEVASAHQYICPMGPVTPLDPKAIKIGTTRYVIDPDRLKANPEHRLQHVWMRKVYGWIRRNIICPVFGPIDKLL